MELKTDTIVKALTALAQATRLDIFKALVVAGDEGLTPSVLAGQLGLAASSLSFHLKELANADLVTQERVGRNLVYRARFEHMQAVLAYLTDNCCQGQPCELLPPPPCLPKS